MNNFSEPPEESDERRKNRRDAMYLAQRQGMLGDPLCGSFFSILNILRRDPNAAFMEDFYEVDFEDDSDDIRPY